MGGHMIIGLPGETRDTIEEYVDINGIPVRIVDTAGIRENAEEVEQLGINRARDHINRADLVLFLVDGARELSDDDRVLFKTVSHKGAELCSSIDVWSRKSFTSSDCIFSTSSIR